MTPEAQFPGPSWPASAGAAAAWQQKLAGTDPPPWRWDGDACVSGCFVCFPRGRTGRGAEGDPAWAAAVLVGPDGPRAPVAVTGRAGGPYIPGLLLLREGPLLEAAVRALPERPDCLLVNGTGRDHPRGAGLALALGAVLDLPTIGVTDRPLLAEGQPPGLCRGDFSVLTLGGTPAAALVRVRSGVRPLVAHPGWRTDLNTAVAVLLGCTSRARTPEPLRLARRAARIARAAAL